MRHGGLSYCHARNPPLTRALDRLLGKPIGLAKLENAVSGHILLLVADTMSTVKQTTNYRFAPRGKRNWWTFLWWSSLYNM
jgi:hypothetical protein